MMQPSHPRRRRVDEGARRPTRLTAKIHRKIVDILQLGYALQTAADYVGVHPGTISRWVRRGDQSCAGPYKQFANEVRSATGRDGEPTLRCGCRSCLDAFISAVANANRAPTFEEVLGSRCVRSIGAGVRDGEF